MNKKISPTLIGAFVVGALSLLVIAVIALGSGRLFRQTREFVLYFDNSVNGLRIGAPVKVKGVEIGSVKDIRLALERGTEVDKIPVIIEIDLEKLTSRGASDDVADNTEAFREAIIKRGLRGQLLMESLVTGLLYVGLDFFPDTPIRLVQQPGARHQYPEIPTTPTSLELAQDAVTQILKKIEEIDFRGVAKALSDTVDGVKQLVNSPALKASLVSLEKTIPQIDEAFVSINKLSTNLDGKMASLTGNLEQTSDATREAMQAAAITLKQTDGALKAAEAALINVNGVVDQDSPTFYELRKSLREVSTAARSLRLLSNYIERNPRALIFGKPENQEGR
ncbi:MAG TPA: MlaD family protein [Candidatus Binatia bacterium]|nr:MlaD family protein [Candidatus Binatia bacterium]